MYVCSNTSELERFLTLATEVSKEYPVVVSEFIEGAKEIEIDAVAQKGELVVYAISEHVEFAGVHSGDATIQFPPQKIYTQTVRRIKQIARQIARELHISGPFNIQFLAKDNDIKVIECNLRASRSFPFVSKVLKINFIELATRVMLEEEVQRPEKSAFDLDYVGIKASQFSFTRLQKADPVLGVDMASTGEVGCIGTHFDDALLTAMLSVGYRIPEKNIVVSSGSTKSKVALLDACRLLADNGYNLFATSGTQKFLEENGVRCSYVAWPDEEGAPKVTEMIAGKEVDLVINIPKNLTERELTNGYKIRRGAIDFNIPLITNARLASAFIKAFCNMKAKISRSSTGENITGGMETVQIFTPLKPVAAPTKLKQGMGVDYRTAVFGVELYSNIPLVGGKFNDFHQIAVRSVRYKSSRQLQTLPYSIIEP